jgi:hypothetical protein
VAGGYTLDIRIEFSAPKLLFGNNFDELDETDFEAVLETLRWRLHEIGVEIRPEVLRTASVSTIHYSKNIILKNYTTSSQVINAIAKLNLNSRLDLNKTDYRNGGHAVRFHANSYEVVFYDKIMDLGQSKISPKRSVEHDGRYQTVEKFPRGLEVLRIEIRLGRRAKIGHLFKKLSISSPICFDGIFKKEIAQKILLHFWEQVERDFDLMQMATMCPEDIFLAIQKSGSVTASKALQLTGAFTLSQSVGLRSLRALVDNGNVRSWSRLRKELESLPKTGMKKLSAIRQIRNSLIDLSPLKLQCCHAVR